MNTREDTRWADDRYVLVELLEHLIETGEVVTARDAVHVVEKPHHYAAEYRRMVAVRDAEAVAGVV